MFDIAVFDFDKTITTCDSLLPFLFYAAGPIKTTAKLAVLSPYFIGFTLGLLPRQKTKEKTIASFFQGMPINSLQQLGESFASQQLDRWVKSEAIERLQWHQTQGHRCILVSASLDIYLTPWAMRYGFTDVLTSSLETNADGLITGNLQGLNCWGPEKARRLQALIEREPKQYKLYVYGDSLGDKDILAMADYPFYRRF